MPVITTLGMLRQENHEFKSYLGYIESLVHSSGWGRGKRKKGKRMRKRGRGRREKGKLMRREILLLLF